MSITRSLPDPFRCSVPPRYEANRQGIQKCRDLASCVPQSSDQLVIYNTFCPATSKGKTSPSLRMTTITHFELTGPSQFVAGSFLGFPPIPPIIIPQILLWYEEIQDGSYPLDLRDATTRSFNTGWIDNELFRIGTPGLYRIDVDVIFVGVDSIIGLILDVFPLLKTVILYIQSSEDILHLDNPQVVGEDPVISYNSILNVVEPFTFRFWIVTLSRSTVEPIMIITKLNEVPGTSMEHINVTRAPYYNNNV